MWNLGDPKSLKVRTFMWNLREPGARFRAAATIHPKALLEEPQAFQVVGEKRSFLDSSEIVFQCFMAKNNNRRILQHPPH